MAGPKTVTIAKNFVKETKNERLVLNSEFLRRWKSLIEPNYITYLAKAIAKHIREYEHYDLEEKPYDYSLDDDDEEEDDDAWEERLVCLGRYRPTDYPTIEDFINTYTDELDEDNEWSWDELRTISGLIVEHMIMFFKEDYQQLLDEMKGESFENLYHRETEVVKEYEIIRQRKKDQSTFTEKSYDRKTIRTPYQATPEEHQEAIKSFLKEVEERELRWYLYDMESEPLLPLFQKGCDLLGIDSEDFIPKIKIENSPTEQILLEVLNETEKERNWISQQNQPLKRCGALYDNIDLLINKVEDEYEVFDDSLVIKEVLNHLRYCIFYEECEDDGESLDSYLRLMAAIYNHQLKQINPNIDATYLNDMFKFEPLKQMLFAEGIELVYKSLYPKLKVNHALKETLPEEPKDYYPEARQLNRHFILHVGETNTGKTYQSLERFKQAQTGVYLAPLRLLALEVQEQMNEQGIPCHLVTGEEELVVEGANHIACTIEKLNLYESYEVAVIDEGQMIGDDIRGGAWTSAILGVCAKEVHICLAPYALELIQQLIEYCGDTFEVIQHSRDSELSLSTKRFDFLSEVEPGDAIVVFSKRKVLNVAAKLMKDKKLPCSLLYGALPYQSRAKQFQDFSTGKTSILVTTDAVGMGVNLPIKRVILLEDSKYDGKQMRLLTTSELKQIGGRAGRKGIYETGEVIFPNKKTQNEFQKQPTPLTVAPLGLTPHILTMKEDLMETVNGWKKLSFGSLFKQVDLSQNIQLLQKASSLGLSKEEQYKAMFLPVNLSNTSQSNLLSLYFRHLKNGAKRVPLPQKPPLQYGDTLNQLEDYYKLLDLYYAFSKTYQLQYEANFIREEREKVSEAINQHLLSKELKVATCSECGKEMAWDSYYYKCDRCYHNRSSYYHYGYSYDFDEDEYGYGY